MMSGGVAALLFLFTACARPQSKGPAYIVDLQHNFDSTRVIIEADGRQMFNEFITSKAELGYAKSVHIPECRKLSIRVLTHGKSFGKTVSLTHKKGAYVGVGLAFGKQLIVVQRKRQFSYD